VPSIVKSEGQYKPGSCTIKTETKLPQNFKTKHFGEFSLVIPYIVYIYEYFNVFFASTLRFQRWSVKCGFQVGLQWGVCLF